MNLDQTSAYLNFRSNSRLWSAGESQKAQRSGVDSETNVEFKEIKISLDFFGLVYPERSRRVLCQDNCEAYHDFH